MNRLFASRIPIVLVILLLLACDAIAQADSLRSSSETNLAPDTTLVRVNPTLQPDTLYFYGLPEVVFEHKWRPKFAPLSFEERGLYWRRIRDVKKVWPYVEMISELIVETYEYMETLPSNRAKRQHLKRFEKELKEQYMPEMKKLTLSQGQLMMKLIDREIGSTPYQIIKAFYGTFTASFYSLFAEFYGGKLNAHYDPRYNRDDALTERILYLYLHHMLD